MSLCRSCEATINESHQYCSQCGAKIIRERLTIKRLFSDFIKLLTNLESPFVKTVNALVVSPKNVTIAYINGKRKVITSPIRNAIIAITVYGVFKFLTNDIFNLTVGNNALEDVLAGIFEGLTDDPVKNETSIDMDRVENIKLFFAKHNQFTNFLVIPFLALICSMVYGLSKYNYAEHFSISLYGVSISLLIGVALGTLFLFFDAEYIMSTYQFLTFIANVVIVNWIVWNSYGEEWYKAFFVFILSYLAFGIIAIITLMSILSI